MDDLKDLHRDSTRKYNRLVDAVSNAIDRADPIGLLKSGAPLDEYSAEIGTIVPRLKMANSAQDVQRIIHEEFLRWFGDIAGPVQEYQQLALDVWQAVEQFRHSAG